MLVLTRKQGEQIRIGDDVVVTIVRTKGKAVRLGIQAPAHVPVLRGEIAAAIAGEDSPTASAGADATPTRRSGRALNSAGAAPMWEAEPPRAGRSQGPLGALMEARGR
jgi:carbon storage regulator